MALLADSLKAYIDSDALTPQQREVCYRDASFVVRACPGSGKTRTTATRFAWGMTNWQSRHSGIAVLSFTNVAWREISQQLHDLGLPSSAPWPHFLGTIDAFVNRHIFLPFGHIVMGCKGRPEIVHEGNRMWISTHIIEPKFSECYRRGCNPLFFEFTAQDQLIYRGALKRRVKCPKDMCDSLKRTMTKRGFALPSDAMYWGLKALENRSIRQAIASRFPEIIIDEAQDTSEVQFKIIESLIEAGAKVVLVGDPDQAIYEFHDARPDLFERFEKRWTILPLSENFRSSQNICDATWRFSSLASAPKAAGPHRAHPDRPIIKIYRTGEVSALLPWFKEQLGEKGIDDTKSVALARRHDLVSELRGSQVQAWPSRISSLSKAFARAAVCRDADLFGEAHDITMWAMLRLCFNRSSYGPRREAIESIGERNWRRKTWRLFQDLPPSSTPLAIWGPKLASIVRSFIETHGWPCLVEIGKSFCRCNDPAAVLAIADFIRPPCSEDKLLCKVIHQAKGESHDAVMVVTAPGKRRKPGDLEQWLSLEANEAAERRTGYVALTRPRKLLVLAIPDGIDLTDPKVASLVEAFDVHT